MTEERRAAQRLGGLAQRDNLVSPAETLRKREAWKYEALLPVLQGRKFQFEFEVGPWVFDLALLDRQVLVEFDGPYHRVPKQAAQDVLKTAAAVAAGFTVVRRIVPQAVAIDPGVLAGL